MAFPYGVVVYINGVRFDPSSVSYTAHDGGGYDFSVDVPAIQDWDILPARSHGAVFFIDPITKTWRFLCEGEYVSVSKAKSSQGTRSRTLFFRSIFGWWDQATYTSLVSLVSPPLAGSALINQQIHAIANGNQITFNMADEQNSKFTLGSLNSLVEFATKGVTGDTFPLFFPTFLQVAAIQTPVEAFYMQGRQLNDKIFAFSDPELKSILDVARFRDLVYNGHNAFNLGPNTIVNNILHSYEDIAFYQRKVLPAPFPFNADTKIMELMWTPQLYIVAPPVCNVIFDSQIMGYQEQRNLLADPTRVIAQVQLPGVNGSNEIPFIYMANATVTVPVFEGDINTLSYNPTAKNASVAMTHDLLSTEEMQKGVIAAPITLGLEKILNTSPTSENEGTSIDEENQATLTQYIKEAVRHHFFVEKIKARTKSLSCVFLPYLVPGFPALVEDTAGPVFGTVGSLTHTINAKSPPTTSVMLTHVRPVFLTGKDKTPTFPPWLNKRFMASQLDETYRALLGIKINNIGDQPNPTRSFTSILQRGLTSDQDAAASDIVAVPHYNPDFTEKIDDGYNKETVSSKLAKTVDPALSYLQFQYREGMALSQYLQFHGLSAANVDNSAQLLNAGLPADVGSGEVATQALNMFGYPNGLTYVGQGNNGSIAGIYNVRGGISSIRQNAARLIATALTRGISAH